MARGSSKNIKSILFERRSRPIKMAATIEEAEHEGGPATHTLEDGTLEWRVDGKLHRHSGPARIRPNGRREYFLDGLRHRDGAPAIESETEVSYYTNGKLNRDENAGPAQIKGGVQKYYKMGALHRTKGAAIIYPNQDKRYFIDGKERK